MNNLDSMERTSSKQIKLAALVSYVTIFFSIASGLIITPWLIRQLGQVDYGLYALSSSMIGFFILDFGLGSAVSRFLAQYKASNDKIGARQFLGITYKLFTIISIIILVVLSIVYFNIENIYVKFSPLEIQKLKVLFLISSLFTIVTFPFKPFDGILIANEKFITIKIAELLNKILVLLLMILALLLGYKLYSIVIINSFVGILIILFKYIFIKRFTETEIDLTYNEKSIYKDIFGFSSWVTVIAVAQRFILLITPTVLGATSGTEQIALFSIAVIIEAYIYMFANAVGGLFLPKVTRVLSHNYNTKELENLLIKVGRIQFFIVGLIIIGFASMGQEFIIIWVGENFKDSYIIALLLILPGLITLTQEIASTTLLVVNKIKFRAYASLITAGISIVLSLLLSNIYGAIGSGLAIFIGNLVGFVLVLNFLYYKVLKINILKFFKECHLKMITPVIITLVIGLVIQHIFYVNSLLLFLLKVLFVGLTYFFSMWFLSLNIYEKHLITGLLCKAIKKRKQFV